MNLQIGEIKEDIKEGSIFWIATHLKISNMKKCNCEECILIGEFFTGALSLRIIDFFTVETMRKIENNKITIFINDEFFTLKVIVEIKNLKSKIISFLIHDLKLETINN